jgi:xyloglucan-specific exo-beta-1,4-glucanase
MVSIPGGNPQSVIGDYTGFNHTSVSEFAPIHVPSPGTSNGIAYAAGNTKVMARVSKSEWSSQTSYYSEDGGKTWSAMKNPSGIKVALSADGSTVVIVTSGGSLQYSTDKGQTFSSCTGASTVSYVAADPVNSKYFYAAADGKIYISSDGGKSFSASTSLTNNTWTRLCVVPDHEGLIYAPCGAAGLEVSTDHGATFSAVSGISSCEAVGNGIGKDGDSYVLYVWGSNADHTGLLRSEDKGATWQIINDDTHQFGGPGNGQFVIGDQNHYGRFYMSTLGMGIVYGDLAANYEAPTWNCFTDNTTCASTDVETVAAVDENSIVTPNPFTTSCSMDENGDYAVLNVLGSVIERGHYTSGARLGANWPAGVYFVRINGNVVRVIKR